MALSLVTSSLTDASTDSIELTCPLLFESLLDRYMSVGNPSKKMKHFCASIMQMCLNQSRTNGSVQSATGRHIRFTINNHQRKFKNMATPGSCQRWVFNKVDCFMSKMLSRLGNKKDLVHILKRMANPLWMVVLRKKSNELNDYQALAIRYHLKRSTEVMKRLVQGLKVFLSDDVIFPSNLSKVMRKLEKRKSSPRHWFPFLTASLQRRAIKEVCTTSTIAFVCHSCLQTW